MSDTVHCTVCTVVTVKCGRPVGLPEIFKISLDPLEELKTATLQSAERYQHEVCSMQ